MTEYRVVAGTGPIELLVVTDAIPDRDTLGWWNFRGLTAVTLRVGGRELRLDTTPNGPPPRPGELPSRLRLRQAVQNAGIWTLPEGQEAELLVHMANPLTPKGQGIWLRLAFRSVGNQLRVESADSRILYTGQGGTAMAALSRWLAPSAPIAALLNQRIPYATEGAWPERAGPLLSDSAKAALVHVKYTSNKSNDQFAIEPTPAGDGAWPLVLSFQLPSETLGSVQSTALGLAEPDARRNYAAYSVRMRCARARRPAAPEWEWLLDWEVPASAPPEQLSLERLWQWRSAHYRQGLAATRARNQLSYVPSRISAVAGAATLRFRVRGETSDAVSQVSLAQVWLTGSGFELEFGNARNLVGDALRITQLRPFNRFQAPGGGAADEGLAAASQQALPRDWLNVEFEPDPGLIPVDAEQVVGAVRVGAHRVRSVRMSATEEAGAARFGSAPLGVDIRLDLLDATLRAASQDPEIGFETLSAWLERDRPMAIDLSDQSPDLRLRIFERADGRQSRLLRIQVIANARIERWEQDVVVLDTAPLTTARVISHTGPLEPNAIIAEYTDDAEQPAEWSYAAGAGEMTVVLPPQGIGEEMIKGHVHLHPGDGSSLVPVPGKLMDFRLTPNAELTLDRTDIDTARAIAPWGLRRLLAQRTGTTGARLTKARVELLYGMLAELQSTADGRRRIAEMDALIGRVPFGDAWLEQLRQARLAAVAGEGSAGEPLRQQAVRLAGWIGDLQRRLSEWTLFADAAVDGRADAEDAAEFVLRETRDTAHPINPRLTATGRVVAHSPLRGGVDWPFQSQAIHDELLSNPKPGTGSIKNLRLGPLGGSGSQLAAFNEGKTQIISDSTQGRLNSVTVIRVGRIAMLWNHARHVIVYERSVRRAPRYTGAIIPGVDSWEAQDARFEGFSALRKVREYIEITQPVRDYPEQPTDRPYHGALVRARFQTTIIPVRSEWGIDLEEGFEMPLRGPIPLDQDRYFPVPQIFLEFARTEDKGGGRVAQQLADPSQLRFYSSTRRQDTGDTDRWPAFPEVDYPVVERPTSPAVPYRSRFARVKQQPDAVAVDFGQGRYSVDLLPAEEAVNLMHGRDVPAIDARLRAVSLARGKPRTPLPQRPSVAAARDFARADGVVRDALGEFTQTLLQQARTEERGLAELPDLRRDADALLSQAQARALAAAGAARLAVNAAGQFNWEAEQARLIGLATARVDALVADLRTQMAVAGGDLEALKREARSALAAARVQAEGRLGELRLMASDAQRRIAAAAERLDQQLAAHLQVALSGIRSGLSRWREQLLADPARSDDLDAAWRQAVSQAADTLSRLAQQASGWIEAELGPWFSRLGEQGAHQRIRQTIEDLIEAAQADLIEDLDNQLPWQVAGPDFDALDDWIATRLRPVSVNELLKDWLAELKTSVAPLDALLQAARDALNTATAKFDEALLKLPDLARYQAELDGWLTGVSSGFTGLHRDLGEEATRIRGSALWKDIEGNVDAVANLENVVRERFDAVRQSLNSNQTLVEFAQVADRELTRLTDHWQAAGQQVLRQVASDLRGQLPELPEAERVIEMTRALATGPVAEALRCSREAVGYYFDALKDTVDLTRSTALFNDLGADALNALSADIPFDRLRDRLLPQLANLNINALFPDFGGLKLEHLLPDLRIPPDAFAEYPWLKVRHGFDRDRLTAWADVDIDRRFDDDATLLNLSPVKIVLVQPRFVGSSRLRISASGAREQRSSAALAADWVIEFSGKPLITFRDATLRLDSTGDFDFDFAPENLELAEELNFVTQALAVLMPAEEGFKLTPLLPAGIGAELSLPLPDLGTGAFTLTGITLHAHFDLLINRGFELRTGLWLSKPDRPFGLAILFLGGGGWFGVEVGYRPPTRFTTRVSIGVSAGAFVALNFGFARASAGLLFTAGVDFYRDSSRGGGSTAISLGLLIWGEFSLMGIAHAYLRLSLRIEYRDGGMTGYGQLSVAIKISFFYTFRLNRSVTKVFAAPKRAGNRNAGAAATAADAVKLLASDRPDYAEKPAFDIPKQVDEWLQTLDLS